mgnify:CR=1 FL=1
MVETYTPECDFNTKAHDFELKNTDGKFYKLGELVGDKATLIMFICNHCPYVKSILEQLVVEASVLQKKGVACIAINSNDSIQYPEDSFENMQIISRKFGFSFPYLLDDTQTVAQSYKAVCTPDFFGYNKKGLLNYRGRISEMNNLKFVNEKNELLDAMTMISKTNRGPKIQYPSAGCSVKWKN